MFLGILVFIYDAFFLGRVFFCKICQINFDNRIERYSYEFGFGGIFLSLAFTFLGIFNLLYNTLLFFIYLSPLIISIFLFFISKHSITIASIQAQFKMLSVFIQKNWISLMLVSFVTFPLLPYLFLYPASWDSLAYHLALPKLYLSLHAFKFMPWFSESAYPIGIESLFGFGEVFGDPRIGSFIIFLFIIALAFYLLYGLKRRFPSKVLILAAMIFLFRPIMYSEVSTNPNVDFPLAFYSLLTFITSLKLVENKKISYIALLMILVFFCFFIKYTGIILLICFGMLILMFNNKRDLFSDIKKDFIKVKKDNLKTILLVIFSLITLIPSGYWMVRNSIYTGNPVYPYFKNIFPSYDRQFRSSDVTSTIRNENLYWKGSYANLILRTDDSQDFMVLFDWVSFYVLIFVLLLGLFITNDKTIKYLSIFALTFLIGIIIGVGPLFRYYFPVYPLISIVFSYVLLNFLEKKKIFPILIASFLIVVVIFQFDSTYNNRYNFFTKIPKLQLYDYTKYEYERVVLSRQDNWDGINYINTNLNKKDDKVLVLFDNRLYYYDIPIVYGSPLLYFSNLNGRSVEEEKNFLASQGINYILESNNWGIPKEFDKFRYNQFVKKYCEKVYVGKSTVVYEINK
jgi:hypothetical protein